MSANATTELPWGQVIGLPVTVGNLRSISREVIRRARQGIGSQVCVANVHMLVTARRDPELREVLEHAAIVVSDGRPLVWRLRGRGFPAAEQVRGPDLMLEVCALAAAEGLPVYFYGGDDQLMSALRATLLERWPTLQIAATEIAPMLPTQPEADPAVIAGIRQSGARIVFVGLGCPKQEFWMAAHGPQLDAAVLGVGQAFGIASGQLAEAPAWMHNLGLEWLFRVWSEPRRLWRRYLVTNSLFVGYVIGEMLGLRADGTPATAARR